MANEFLYGKAGGFQQVPTSNPAQQGAVNTLLGYALPQLTSNKFDFGPIAENARKNYWEKSAPLIKEKFRSLDALGSSGYKNSLQSGAAELESNLAAQQQGYNLQQQSQLLSLLGHGLTPQFENVHFQHEPGFLENLTGGISQGVGASIPGVVQAGVDAFGNWIGGKSGSGAQQQQQPGGIQALNAAGNAAANTAASTTGQVAATAGTSVLAPAATAALGGLTTAGKVGLVLGAGALLAAGGYYLYDFFKNKWQKKREATAQEKQRIQQLQNGTRQQQIDAGLIPLQPGPQPGFGGQPMQQGMQQPGSQGMQAMQQAPRVVCNGGICSIQQGPPPANVNNYQQQRALGYIR